MRLKKSDIGDCMLQRVCTHTSHDRQTCCMLLCDMKHLYLFLITQTWSLTGRSKRYKEIDTASHLPVHEGSKCFIIDLAVSERGYKGCSAASESFYIHILKFFHYLEAISSARS